MSRSAWTTLVISGRRILSATVRPSRRTARWTWEIEAEATGCSSSVEEDLAQGAAVLLGEDRLDLAERERPHVVAEGGELGGVGFGEDVGPGGEHLPQLDESRPEVLADQPQPAGPILRGGLGSSGHPLDGPNDPFEMERRHDVVVAVSHKRRQDLPVARKVPKMADRFA